MSTKDQAVIHQGDTGELHRCLTAFDLILLGVGAIIGAGIFVLTGIAAATKAGPAIMISFVIASIACAFSAFCYAELSSAIGGCGGAYDYAKTGFGRMVGWIIAWALILEYGISSAAVAVGWSGYLNTLLLSIGIQIPKPLLHGPFDHGIINLPALLIVALIAAILVKGMQQSARLNAIIVYIKLAVIALFIILAFRHINFSYWHDFAPFGVKGIASGAAFIFFAFIGFDAVSTAAEETINPQRNLPIGIMGSLIICTLFYILVSGLITLIAPYQSLNDSSPIAHVLLGLGYNFVASIIAVGALAGLTTVILVMYYGMTRIILALSRDHLLPKSVATVHPKTKTPVRIIIVTFFVIGFGSAFVPIDTLVGLVNIGTLTAFTIVCAGVVVLRYTKPDMERPFKVPFSPVIPSLGVLTCLYLIYNQDVSIWIQFIIWIAIGMIIYLAYGKNNKNKLSAPQVTT
ncbi:MAG: APC family permease [Gammaproteobacteria bacterium]